MKTHFKILILGSAIFLICFFVQIQGQGLASANSFDVHILRRVGGIQEGLKLMAAYAVFVSLTLGHAICGTKEQE